nr:Chain C, PEPTIDE [Human immunodeficiency virus 1]3W39_C Chain C, peptid from Gag-Pol polyprotein [Human immunodeficiency virus type 1 (Z2/CDC-Z34 ISOLATE)]3W39_F Chain F, peptid from Gag-Pol polyprotein [Human immunodeficiency virus type 1 (Z2/CDC-Z34 ISOLATE)]4MJI_C Chain C, HIV Reverse Transcriptase peptide Marker [Human immunodeficiency virus 1]4MJI_H Chain H, HIV Reverse Transcriptase peptide Marker [Human immunodeficiency virus 1]
TAFTIPSI